MVDCKSTTTPMEVRLKLWDALEFELENELVYRQFVDNLIYLITTRSNLRLAVNYFSRFTVTSMVDHWMATKRIVRYVNLLRLDSKEGLHHAWRPSMEEDNET
jgi:hypothetical protein